MRQSILEYLVFAIHPNRRAKRKGRNPSTSARMRRAKRDGRVPSTNA